MHPTCVENRDRHRHLIRGPSKAGLTSKPRVDSGLSQKPTLWPGREPSRFPCGQLRSPPYLTFVNLGNQNTLFRSNLTKIWLSASSLFSSAVRTARFSSNSFRDDAHREQRQTVVRTVRFIRPLLCSGPAATFKRVTAGFFVWMAGLDSRATFPDPTTALSIFTFYPTRS